MQCKYAFLCDYAQDSGGKVHAIGIGWDTIFAGALPATHPSMCFVASLHGSVAESGTKQIELRLIDADGENVIPPIEAQLPFEVQPPRLEGTINLVVQLAGIQLPKLGAYAIHMLSQGHEMTSVSFRVVSAPTTA